MDPGLPAALLHDGLRLLVEVGGPLVLLLLASGLTMGVLQAATQINDPAVGFVPRLCIALGAVWLMGGWMMGRLSGFFAHAVAAMVAR